MNQCPNQESWCRWRASAGAPCESHAARCRVRALHKRELRPLATAGEALARVAAYQQGALRRDAGVYLTNAAPAAPAPTETRGADVAPAVDRDARRGITEFQAPEGITGNRGDAAMGLTVRSPDNGETFIVVVKGDEARSRLSAGQRAPESVRGKVTVESSLRAGRLPPRDAAMPGRPGRGASLVGCDGERVSAWHAVSVAETESAAAHGALDALQRTLEATETAYICGVATWSMLCHARSERARAGERASIALLELKRTMRALCALDRTHESSIAQRPAAPAGEVKRVKHRGKRPEAPPVTRR